MLKGNKYYRNRLSEIDQKIDAVTNPADAVTLVQEKQLLMEEENRRKTRIMMFVEKMADISGKVAIASVPIVVAVLQINANARLFQAGIEFEKDGTVCSDMNKQIWRNSMKLR